MPTITPDEIACEMYRCKRFYHMHEIWKLKSVGARRARGGWDVAVAAYTGRRGPVIHEDFYVADHLAADPSWNQSWLAAEILAGSPLIIQYVEEHLECLL